jgi:hypothetical protein
MALTSIARHLRVSRATAVVYSIVFVSLPVLGLLTLNTAKPDPVLFATFAVGSLFLLRHWRTRAGSDLLIAALALGIAFGSKWNGMSAVAIVLLVWATARLLYRVPFARVARELGKVAVVVFAFAVVWLVRNTAASGNPLYPLHLKVGGLTLLPAPEDLQRKRFNATIAQYLTDPFALRHYILPPMYKLMLGTGGVMIVLLLFAAAFIAFGSVITARRRRRAALSASNASLAITRDVAGIATAALLIGVAYLFTPYSAQLSTNGLPDTAWVNVRYGVPALELAVPCVAWLADRAGRFRWPLLLLAILALLEDVHRSIGSGPWYVSPARIGGVAAISIALIGVAVVARRVVAGLNTPVRFGAIGATAVFVTIAIAAVGYADQRRFLDHRYTTFDAALTWVQKHAPKDRRIGLAGEWKYAFFSPEFPMFGPRFRNRVSFIGPVRKGMLLEYSRQSDFDRAARRGRFDLVLVENAPKTGLSREERWLTRLGYTRIVTSPWLHLLERRREVALREASRG